MILTKTKYCITSLLLLLAVAGRGIAQNSYFCDFEDPIERSQWTLNPHKASVALTDFDQLWYLGEPGQCGPKTGLEANYGLYVSSDAGESVCYKGSKASYITAYRNLTLAAGTYTVRFDWMFQGKSNDKVAVAWMPTTERCNSSPNTASLPTFSSTQEITKNSTLRGASAWQSFSTSFTVPAGTTSGRLVFYFWTADGGAVNPAAAIDNIEIVQTSCAAPTNLKYDSKTGTLSWSGQGYYYDIRYYSLQAGIWYSADNHLGKSYHVDLQDEGYTYFYVRQVCDSASKDHSDWVTTGQFTFIPGRRCIEYLDLGKGGSSATGQCYESNFAGYTNTPNNNGDPIDPADPSQYNQADVEHVLHTNPQEIDPNTTINGGLKTVPDGEIASVRLGAYTSSGNSARVVYRYHVQPGVSDLMILKYAPVLLSGGHGDGSGGGDVNPCFKLEVLDANGQPLGSSCTQADFKAGFGDTQAWHQEAVGQGLYWSDWQTITFSLREYINQTLMIRLTAIRCSYDTHYAYAYFTMGCKSGEFEGIACGDFAVDKFTAPEGFYYRWHKASDPDQRTLGTDRVYNISLQDTAVYTVDLISKNDLSCYYTLTANPNPRFPISNLRQGRVTQKDCKYEVEFRNDAYVAYVNRLDTTIHTRSSEAIDGIYWDFGDGQIQFTTDTVLSYAYDGHGGTFTARCTVSMSNGVCTQEDSVTFFLPDMYTPGANDTVHRCEGESYRLPSGQYVTSDTTVYTVTKNLYDCDKTDTLVVRFHPVSKDTVSAIICEGGYYEFESRRFYQSVEFDTTLYTAYHCDSMRHLSLTVVPAIQFVVPDTMHFCDDEIELAFNVSVNAGIYSGMAIIPDASAVSAGFHPRYEFWEPEVAYILSPVEYVYVIEPDTTIVPGHYTFQFEPLSERCPAEAQPMTVSMHYSSRVLYQKSGYIVLYNPEYNYGGYSFSSYRWYRDGVLLPDTKSYIQPTSADYYHEFQVLLTRSNDGVTVESCPFLYTGSFTPHGSSASSSARVRPTLLTPGSPMTVSGEGNVRVVSPMGEVVGRAVVHEGTPVQLAAPGVHGIYFVIVDGESFRVLVQ